MLTDSIPFSRHDAFKWRNLATYWRLQKDTTGPDFCKSQTGYTLEELEQRAKDEGDREAVPETRAARQAREQLIVETARVEKIEAAVQERESRKQNLHARKQKIIQQLLPLEERIAESATIVANTKALTAQFIVEANDGNPIAAQSLENCLNFCALEPHRMEAARTALASLQKELGDIERELSKIK